MKHALLLLFVVATQASAQIVYTDVIPDANYGGTNDSCYLDLDNNGQTDFLIIRREDPAYCSSCLIGTHYRVLIYPMATHVVSGFSWLSQQFPQCHQSGQVIGTNMSYSVTNGLMRDGSPGGGCNQGFPMNCVPWPPFSWANFPEGYLGLRFDIAGATHYGWARLSIPSATGFTLKDYAYNSVPDEGIFAGQTQCAIPFALAVNDVDSNSVVLTWEAFGTDTFNLRYRPTGAATWSEIDTITTTNFTVAGLADCTEYEFKLNALCDGDTTAWSGTFSFTTLGCGACLDIPYCPSASNDASGMWIAGVQVGTLDHQTGSNGGYGNHTAFGTELEIGALHPITLTPGYAGDPLNVYFKVFLDLDHDGSFTSAGEVAYNAGGVTQGPISGTLNIPEGALVGRTRMRVIMRFANAGAVGCTNAYAMGETEDYCVDLVDYINGVGESPTSGQLRLFPNPFTSTLTVALGMYKAGMATCTVRALTGQVLVTRTVATTPGQSPGQASGGSITLDLAALAPGTYLLEVQVDGERMVRKVMKL